MGLINARDEVAWAAGFFEGEGSTIIARRQNVRNKQLMISITQHNSAEVLYRFRAAVGCGKVNGPYKSRLGHPSWQYQVSALEDVRHVLKTMWGDLGPVKRAQALDALDEMNRYQDEPRTHRGRYGRTVAECQRGHAYTPENTYIHPQRGHRECKTCRNTASRNRAVRS